MLVIGFYQTLIMTRLMVSILAEFLLWPAFLVWLHFLWGKVDGLGGTDGGDAAGITDGVSYQ